MIKDISIPDTVTEVGKGSLSSCLRLEHVRLPDNITSIPWYLFNSDYALKTVDMPSDLTSIGYSAFGSCISLLYMDIPDGVSEIENAAFMDCMSLRAISFPESLSVINESVCAICDSLQEVHFPSKLKRIEYDAFSECYNLNRVILPDGLEFIGHDAFSYEDVSHPQEIYVPASVTEIEEDAFNEKNSTIYGFTNSLAEEYAKNHNIHFIAVNESMYDKKDKIDFTKYENAEPIKVTHHKRSLTVKRDIGDLVEILIDGNKIDFIDAQPYIDENGRTQIPIRAVAEALGCEVSWDDATQAATITHGDKVVLITIGKNILQVGNDLITMDTAAEIKDDRTYIPVRFVGEALGMTVNWVNY